MQKRRQLVDVCEPSKQRTDNSSVFDGHRGALRAVRLGEDDQLVGVALEALGDTGIGLQWA
jgi:hypothetical protein